MVRPVGPTIFTMSATPFDQDGQLDEPAFRSHLERQAEAGCGVYVGSPGSGEGAALSLAELDRLYRIAVDHVGERIPVYANPPESATAVEMLEKARIAIDAGVDCVEVYAVEAGHGIVPGEEEKERYYRDVLDEIDHPVALSVHKFSSWQPTIPLMRRLVSDYESIVAVHVMDKGTDYRMALQRAVGDHISVYGPLESLFQDLAVGLAGCQTWVGNVLPATCVSAMNSYLAGSHDQAVVDFRRLMAFSEALGSWNDVARRSKLGLAAFRLPGGNGIMRRPFLLPAADAQQARELLYDAGVLELT